MAKRPAANPPRPRAAGSPEAVGAARRLRAFIASMDRVAEEIASPNTDDQRRARLIDDAETLIARTEGFAGGRKMMLAMNVVDIIHMIRAAGLPESVDAVLAQMRALTGSSPVPFEPVLVGLRDPWACFLMLTSHWMPELTASADPELVRRAVVVYTRKAGRTTKREAGAGKWGTMLALLRGMGICDERDSAEWLEESWKNYSRLEAARVAARRNARAPERGEVAQPAVDPFAGLPRLWRAILGLLTAMAERGAQTVRPE